MLTAAVRYEFDGAVAEQRSRAREVDDATLNALAADAGLRMASALDEAATLVELRLDADHIK